MPNFGWIWMSKDQLKNTLGFPKSCKCLPAWSNGLQICALNAVSTFKIGLQHKCQFDFKKDL